MVAAVTDGMLSLESPRWASLTQSYGTAEDVPRLLEALACIGSTEARAEVWFALWRTLHRPQEAYSASYAAVPHLLTIGRALSTRECVEAVHLVTRIEVSRRDPASASMPDDLLAAYGEAVDSLPAIVASMHVEPWTADMAQILAAALLAGKRQPELARDVLELGRRVVCPTCGTDHLPGVPRD